MTFLDPKSVLADYDRIRERAMQSLFDCLDALCEGTLVVDRNARIVWINERYAHRFGLRSAAEAIGRDVEDVIPRSLMRQVVETGNPILLDILDAGSESFVVTRLPLKDDDGEVIGAVGFALYDELQPLQPLYERLHALRTELAQTQRRLAEERRAKYTFSNFLGTSPKTMELKRQARRAAMLDTTVLLLGETGTGKELVAQAIHAASKRAERPFVGINTAAIPETLLENEFFGSAPGAFTGADRKGRSGKFEIANGGTLFLDEIGDMPIGLQAKLLRVLQEQEFEAIGSNRIVRVDVRVIAATTVDLARRVADGQFRADLYYRLNVLPIGLPPLRERGQDIELLCEHIFEQIARRTGLPQREIEPDAADLLRRCPWKGNVRELRNVLEQATMMSDRQRLSAADLAPIVGASIREDGEGPSSAAALPGALTPSYDEALAAFERQLVVDALARHNGSVTDAARALGIGRATLYKKIATLGIDTAATRHPES